MDTIFTEVCALVTAAFVLTLVPGFRRSERSLLSMRDRGTALLVFLILGLVEEVTSSEVGWLNERIVAVCAAGLVAGPFVGVAVSVFVTWLAVRFDGLPFESIGISMLCGGLVGGLLVSVASSTSATPADRILSDFGGIVVQELPGVCSYSDPSRDVIHVRAGLDSAGVTRFGRGPDSGNR